MTRALWVGLLGVALITITPPRAEAHMGWSAPQNWVLLGGPLCLSYEGQGGVCSGFEASVVHFNPDDGLWLGGYFDALYHGASETLRLSLGPEIGLLFFGLDGGVSLESGPSGSEVGYVLRALVAFVAITPYLRYGQRFTGDQGYFFEGGLLLKLPLQL
ncbi:hypothetical protein KJ940_17215 [Myxococcota bacterium]|nr:hypothetical protein [Myxococcota bacterium]